MKVLVTGSNGFVGGAVLQKLTLMDGIQAFGSVRAASPLLADSRFKIVVGNLSGETDWFSALSGVDVVVHAAARVHVMNESSTDPLAEFRRTNVEGTLNLARQAELAGVRRLIFVSSIKVNGEATTLGNAFSADDIPAPTDHYGISKMEAEQGLQNLTRQTKMKVVIIRPPLVYGIGVRANFQAMMRWLERGIPLPFGAIENSRSLVALDNLVDLIVTCLNHPAAANQTFLVSDGEDLSTTQLLQRMGHAMGKPARLVPIPAWLLSLSARMIGKPALAHRLCGSLKVDIAKTRQLLGWAPLLTVNAALKKAAKGYSDEASV